MNRAELLERIRRRARQDEKHRRDRRFLDTMGLLVAKGLLRTNVPLALRPNKRVRVEDALWAGRHVEPRILEVLPAAILRLGRHFDLDPDKHADLARVVARLRAREDHGEEFRGIPYAKLKIWAEMPLPDRRVKPAGERKLARTFRLHPRVSERLQELARERRTTATAILESLILGADTSSRADR
jgi:hypothetical protein